MSYDSLAIVGISVDNIPLYIQGKTDDGSLWFFEIPDSAMSAVPGFAFIPKSFKDSQGQILENRRIIMRSCDSVFSAEIPVGASEIKITARHIDSYTRKDVMFYKAGLPVIDENVYFADMKTDRFSVQCDNSEFELISKYPNFAALKNIEQNHDELIDEYREIIENNPDSRYLIVSFVRKIHEYSKKSDVHAMYNSFSKNRRNDAWGKRIKEYMDKSLRFYNISLYSLDNKCFEPIIQDTTKLNFVVFSASWCVPCRAEIPLLKALYEDLKDKITITYISIDEQETVENWRSLMKEEDIPWRSLSAADSLAVIKELFPRLKGGIPCNILVFPSGEFEILDIRKNEDKKRLYDCVAKMQQKVPVY